MAQLATIPTPVAEVTVKHLLSISQLGFADQCLLRVAFGASNNQPERLPEHPAAALGSILHRLLEQAAKGQIRRSGSTCDDAEAALDALLREAKTDFALSLAPQEWASRKASAIAGAAKRLERSTRTPGAVPSNGRRMSFEDLPADGVWGEVVVKSNTLRLSGQIDFVEKREPKVMVTDTKTGRIEDRDGALLRHIELQLRLYGLAVREHLASWTIGLSVEREREWSISFESDDEAETQEWLREKLSRLPANAQLSAKSLACVGEACRTCPYRHVCPSYCEAAPQFWKAGACEGPMPGDIWGRIEQVRETNGMHDVDLRDAANRCVRITGIDPEWNLLEQATKELPVYFFGLATEKPQFHRGVWKHHLNFHEIPRSRRGRRAVSLAIFRG